MVDRDVAASATAVRIARTPTSTAGAGAARHLRAREAASLEKSNNVESDASAINHMRILLSPLHVLVVKSSDRCENGRSGRTRSRAWR
jgi:hypothetical protein